MDVRLPNGTVIKGVPDGTSKDAIRQKAISAGLATAEDFGSAPKPKKQRGQSSGGYSIGDAMAENVALPPGFVLDEPVQAEQDPSRPSIKGGRGIGAQISNQRGYDLKKRIEEQVPLFEGDPSQLKEIGAAPELNKFSGSAFKSSLAANLIGSDFELAQALEQQIPGITFSRDKDLNLIANTPSGGSYYLNAPGFSGQDIAKFATRAGAYAVPGAGSLPVIAGKAAATESLLQGGEKAVGGEFNPEDIGIATVAAPVGQVVGQRVIAPALQLPGEVIKRVFRGGEAGRQNLSAAISDFAEFGGSPSVGQGSGEGVMQGIENLSGRILGGRPIRTAIERTTTRIQNRLQNIADNLSTTRGDVEAGRVINRGITGPGGFIERFQERSRALWDGFDGMIDDATPVNIPNTTRALDNLVSDTRIGQVLNNPLLVRVRDALTESGNQVSYQELRALRSEIGRRLADNALISDIPRSQLRQIYGALSQDLRALAEGSGERASQAFNRANRYTASGHGRIDDFLERVVNKADLDKVFQSVAKGGEGIQQLNAFKRSLRPQEWEVVASNVVRRLGRATSGRQDDLGEVFSVNKMLTDWNKLGRAKDVIFSGSDRLNTYRANLNRIAAAANRFKQSAAEMANPSGTGQFVANVGAISTAASGLITGNLVPFGLVLTGIAGNNAAARLMTNPRFVQWLAQGTTTRNWPAHLSRLSAVAAASANKEEILELLETLKTMSQATNQNPNQEPKQ